MAVVSRDNAEHYCWGKECEAWHLVKSPTLSVIQERVPPGAGEGRHRHHNAEQFFFILSGLATMEVEGTVYTLKPQQGIHIPAGQAHQLSNQGQQDVILTVTSTPPSHGDREELPGLPEKVD